MVDFTEEHLTAIIETRKDVEWIKGQMQVLLVEHKCRGDDYDKTKTKVGVHDSYFKIIGTVLSFCAAGIIAILAKIG